MNELLASPASAASAPAAGLPDYQFGGGVPFVAGPVGQYATIGHADSKKGKAKLALIRPDLASAAALKGFLEPAIKSSGAEFVAASRCRRSDRLLAVRHRGHLGRRRGRAHRAVRRTPAKQFLTAAIQLDADFTVGPLRATSRSPSSRSSCRSRRARSSSTPSAITVSQKQFPALKQFKADMKAANDPLVAADKLKTTQLRSWVSVLAFEKFTEGLSTIDAASVLAAVKAAQDVDLEGLTSPWTPSNPGPTPLFKQISQPDVWVMTFDGKKITLKEPAVDGYAGFQTS